LQARQQADLDRARLFAHIGHEVRNPLNGLLGFPQLMRRSPLSEQQRSHLEQISLCGTTTHNMVSDMLDFSRLEVQPAAPNDRAFRPHEVVSEAMAMLCSVAQQNGLPIVLEGQAPPEAVGDVLRLQQVLPNLLGNALKFTQHGQVTVLCQAGLARGGQAMLRIEFEDSGIGLPSEALPQLFQLFLPIQPVNHPTVRRHGVGPGDLQATGRCHGWSDQRA
jgi:signal transduction histidine kinase